MTTEPSAQVTTVNPETVANQVITAAPTAAEAAARPSAPAPERAPIALARALATTQAERGEVPPPEAKATVSSLLPTYAVAAPAEGEAVTADIMPPKTELPIQRPVVNTLAAETAINPLTTIIGEAEKIAAGHIAKRAAEQHIAVEGQAAELKLVPVVPAAEPHTCGANCTHCATSKEVAAAEAPAAATPAAEALVEQPAADKAKPKIQAVAPVVTQVATPLAQPANLVATPAVAQVITAPAANQDKFTIRA